MRTLILLAALLVSLGYPSVHDYDPPQRESIIQKDDGLGWFRELQAWRKIIGTRITWPK